MQIRSDHSRFSLFPIGLNKGTKPSCGSEHAAGIRPACTGRRCFLCLAGEHLGWVTEHPNITVPMQPVSISTRPRHSKNICMILTTGTGFCLWKMCRYFFSCILIMPHLRVEPDFWLYLCICKGMGKKETNPGYFRGCDFCQRTRIPLLGSIFKGWFKKIRQLCMREGKLQAVQDRQEYEQVGWQCVLYKVVFYFFTDSVAIFLFSTFRDLHYFIHCLGKMKAESISQSNVTVD